MDSLNYYREELLEAGIPKERIVLAFHPPNLRQYTEFAVG